MLSRMAGAAVLLVLAAGVLQSTPANARVPLPQCTVSGAASAHGSQVGGSLTKKCKRTHTATGSGTGTSSGSTHKRWCPIVVRLVDGSCPGPGPNGLPQPVNGFKQVVPTEQTVMAELTLPDATPRFGPDPSVNEWNMLAVGFPIWLWTDGPRRLSTHPRRDGLDLEITATWQSTRFTMGDGQVKTCAAMTEYPPHPDHPGTPSPTCGYVYEVASPKGRPYVVVAEETWRIDWSSGGGQGSFLHTYRGSRTLEVGELMSLIRG